METILLMPCWERSWKRHDLQVTLELPLDNLGSSPPSLVLGKGVLLAPGSPRGCSMDIALRLRTPTGYTWPNLVSGLCINL